MLIGQPGYKRSDPDYFPLLVGNYILGGGGFVSRLTEEVREKRGLSYSVYSYFSPGPACRRLHASACRPGPTRRRRRCRSSRDVVARFVAEGPTAAELKAAKDNLIGGFPLRIDSNRKLLDNVANIAWNDLPLDYLDTWTAQVAKVTAADIRAAFARKLQPERMVTVIVGGDVATAPTVKPSTARPLSTLTGVARARRRFQRCNNGSALSRKGNQPEHQQRAERVGRDPAGPRPFFRRASA